MDTIPNQSEGSVSVQSLQNVENHNVPQDSPENLQVRKTGKIRISSSNDLRSTKHFRKTPMNLTRVPVNIAPGSSKRCAISREDSKVDIAPIGLSSEDEEHTNHNNVHNIACEKLSRFF